MDKTAPHLYKKKYRIDSTRLQEWNYSSAGRYFVTICTQGHKKYFGDIINGKIHYSTIGNITRRNWKQIPKHHANVHLDVFIVMPNHIHGIINILPPNECRDAINRVSTTTATGGICGNKNPMISNRSLSAILRAFKARCTKIINNSKQDITFAWQPRFHDHIIRTENGLRKIREYIMNNPLKWHLDNYNPHGEPDDDIEDVIDEN